MCPTKVPVVTGFNAILADEMGLGKTIQALAVISADRKENKDRPSLVICPKSLIDNWFNDNGVGEEAKDQQHASYKIGRGQYKQYKPKEQEDNEWWNGYLPLEPAKKNVEDHSYRRRRPRSHSRNYYSIVYPQDLKPQDYVVTSLSSHQITLPTNWVMLQR